MDVIFVITDPKTSEKEISIDLFFICIRKTPEDDTDTCHSGYQVHLGQLPLSYLQLAISKSPTNEFESS